MLGGDIGMGMYRKAMSTHIVADDGCNCFADAPRGTPHDAKEWCTISVWWKRVREDSEVGCSSWEGCWVLSGNSPLLSICSRAAAETSTRRSDESCCRELDFLACHSPEQMVSSAAGITPLRRP